MENASFEQAVEVVKSLPVVDKRRLHQWLIEDEHTQRNGGANGEIELAYPREREMGWLSHHEAEYAEQWLALDGDRSVSHGTDPHRVFAEAQAQGIADPFMAFAESDEPSMGGW